jgi:hypothetical protein
MESVKDLLTDPLKGKNRAQGVLCFLFREVLLWRRINQIVWNKRLEAYFQKPHNRIKPDKGNLNKAFLNDDMSWAAFKKGIDFLSPVEATLVFEYIWSDDTVSTYEVKIDPVTSEKEFGLELFPYDRDGIFSNGKKINSTLALMYRHITSTQIDSFEQWEQLFTKYIDDPTNNVGISKTDLQSSVSMLKKSLLEGKFSWMTFRRGILLMTPKQEKYTLKLKWTDDPQLLRNMPDEEYPVTIINPYGVTHDTPTHP